MFGQRWRRMLTNNWLKRLRSIKFKVRVPSFNLCKDFQLRKPSWLIVFQLLFSEATLPGLRNVFGFSPPLPRLLFAVVFIYLVYTTVSDIKELVTNYLEYNTSLQVTIEEPLGISLMMPAVTVCNKDPVLLSAFCNHQNRDRIEFETNKTCLTSKCETFVSKYYETICSGNESSRDALRINFGIRDGGLGHKVYKMFQEWYEKLMSFEKGRELLVALSYQSHQSLVSSCFFNAKNCTSALRKVLLPNYGNCFCVFCDVGEPVTQFETHLNGLMLSLVVMENESMPMSPTTGHLVMINNPEEQANVAEDSVFVHPRATTYIGLQKEQNIRLPPPSKDPCTLGYPTELIGYLEPKYKRSYSMLRCQQMCAQIAVLKACNCVDFKFILPVNVATSECSYVLPSATARRNSTLRCAIETVRRIERFPFRCGCLRPCVEDRYRKVNSALFWHPRLQTKKQQQSSGSTVFVFMQTNKINVRRKVIQTTWKDLLNSIGGTMGLYLGYSYLFAIYIIDILIRGIVEIISWTKFKRRQSRQNNIQRFRKKH